MTFVTCEKCYLPDISKVHAKFFGFETRNELSIFILNLILNIESSIKNFARVNTILFVAHVQ